MRRKFGISLAVVAIALFPTGALGQTGTTTSTSSTTTSTTTTTTTLPICVPGVTPDPQPGRNCILPFLECIAVLNPPPHCPKIEGGPGDGADTGGVATVSITDTAAPAQPATAARTTARFTG